MCWEELMILILELLFLGIGTWFDIRYRELPMNFLMIYGVFGVFCNVFLKYQSMKAVVFGGMIGVCFLLIGRITKEAIGYGDGIGIGILGIFEGFSAMVPVVFGAFFVSGIYGLWKLWWLKQCGRDTMPFFPFLLAAFVGVKIL